MLGNDRGSSDEEELTPRGGETKFRDNSGKGRSRVTFDDDNVDTETTAEEKNGKRKKKKKKSKKTKRTNFSSRLRRR